MNKLIWRNFYIYAYTLFIYDKIEKEIFFVGRMSYLIFGEGYCIKYFLLLFHGS